jgi:hypothetical protein
VGAPADAVGVTATYDEARHESPAGVLPLDRAQLEALAGHVDAAVTAGGCDRTRRVTDAWAAEHGVALDPLHQGLEEYGGFCDCEVVMNVDPDLVFPPTGS